MLNTLIEGLCLGGIYALIALGYTMVYGIAKMLNFAHGDIIMVGAYSIVTTLSMLGADSSKAQIGFTLAAIAAAVIICTLLGVITERVAYRPLRGASPLAVLITAIGVSYLLQSIAQLIFGSNSTSVSGFDLFSGKMIGGTLPLSSLVTLGLCVVIMVGLTLFINKTRIGSAMLAASEDRGAAELMGINTNGIITLTFAIGSALAAFASTFYIISIPAVNPTLGAMPGIMAFTAAVIGGIGSIPGAMVGGLLLGIIEKYSQSFAATSPYTTAIEFGLLVLILLVKPTGILGKQIREKV